MNVCGKCGAVLREGSRFCGKCGASVDMPDKRICPRCGNEVADGLFFCNRCGARIEPLAAAVGGGYPHVRTLVVTREPQFQCAGNSYRLIVDGEVLGNMSVGASLRTAVASDTATVEIVCTTLMVHAKLRLVLRLGNNPKLSFKVKWPGTVIATASDAEILEQQRNY